MKYATENDYLRTAFLGRVAHELRGPAGTIQGVMQALEAALGDAAEGHAHLFAMARRGVGRIVRSADRLEQTGQLERGSVAFNQNSYDLTELVRDAVVAAQALHGQTKIALELHVPPNPQLCTVDARWMSIVLYELTSNALRHALERVHVFVEPDTHDPARLAIAFVDDNRTSRAFAPMRFRETTDGPGLGLALSIVQDVMRAHGGELRIEQGMQNGEAYGARVSVFIPRIAQPLNEST